MSSSLLGLWADIQPDVSRLCSTLCQHSHLDDAFTPGRPAWPYARAAGWDTEGGPWPAAWLAASEPSDGGGLSRLGVPDLGSAHALNCSSLCESVAGLLTHSVLSPSELPQSDISASLRLRGLTCMYFFCLAVVLSLSVSVLVDNLDDEHRRRRESDARWTGLGRVNLSRPASLDASPGVGRVAGAAAGADTGGGSGAGVGSGASGSCGGGGRGGGGGGGGGNGRAAGASGGGNRGRGNAGWPSRAASAGRLGTALLESAGGGADGNGRPDAQAAALGCECAETCVRCAATQAHTKAPMTALWREGGGEGRLHVVLVTCQIGLTVFAFSTPLFERRLDGSLALLLAHYGFDFTGFYSMFELGMLSAAVGGWALIMSATFWVFIIVCPLVRGFSLLHLLLTPLTRPTARRLHAVSRAVSYYYAFEVMLVAVPLIGITIQPMTSSLFTDFNTPICKQINQAFPNPPGTDPPNLCFTITVVPSAGYWVVAAAVGLFLVSGFDGSPTHKFIHRRLYPGDEPPPNLAACTAVCCGRS